MLRLCSIFFAVLCMRPTIATLGGRGVRRITGARALRNLGEMAHADTPTRRHAGGDVDCERRTSSVAADFAPDADFFPHRPVNPINGRVLTAHI